MILDYKLLKSCALPLAIFLCIMNNCVFLFFLLGSNAPLFAALKVLFCAIVQ